MLNEKEVRSILIVGMAGGLARLTCELLRKKFPNANILGVDSRRIKNRNHLKGVHFKQIRYHRSDFEKLFRSRHFDVVFHLGRLSHASMGRFSTLSKRLEMSLVGTQHILDLCLKNRVSKVVVLSTFHVYGAYADNAVFMNEEAPLRASMDFADLRDVVEMDFTATNWMWKHQNDIKTIVFRPCNIIGKHVKNTMTRYLSNKLSPYPVDYNPAFQFIHEQDMASILVRSLTEAPTGVYNVAPSDIVSIRDALTQCGNKGLPLPMFIVSPITKFLKSWGSGIPDYLFEYLKYPCLIDNTLIKSHLGKNFTQYDTNQSLKMIRKR